MLMTVLKGDLATKQSIAQVKNNINKFPERYHFQLTKDEVNFVMSKKSTSLKNYFSGQSGGTRKLPYAFTEQGIYMLMTILMGDLATKQSIAQVKNNMNKFPERYRFQLSRGKVDFLRSKKSDLNSWSKKSTLNKSGDARGTNMKYLPYAFTEQGIYMLMTVLKDELATRQSIALIDAFKQMKDYIGTESVSHMRHFCPKSSDQKPEVEFFDLCSVALLRRQKVLFS